MIFRLSSPRKPGLSALAKRWADYLQDVDGAAWPDLCAIVAQCPFEEHNLTFWADSAPVARELLTAFLSGAGSPGVHVGPASPPDAGVVFVYSGQGGQWRGMGKALFEEEAIFRHSVEQLEPLVEAESGFSVSRALVGEGAAGELATIDVIQPTLFAMQVGLTNLMRSWGVTPTCVLGHSSGEVAAAYCAGGLSLADATAVICRRSRLMRRIAGRGLMLFVGVPAVEAERLAAPFAGISLAATNGPSASVLSGDAARIQELHEHLNRRAPEVFSRLVKVDVASHSDQVEAIREALLNQLADLAPALEWNAQFYSTVTGGLAMSASLAGEHWWQSLRQPVLFYPAVRKLLQAGHRNFVEIGPHPVLAGNISECAGEGAAPPLVLAAQERGCDGRAWLRDVVAQLNSRGVPVKLQGRAARLAHGSLPSASDEETASLEGEFAVGPESGSAPLGAELRALPAERRREVIAEAVRREVSRASSLADAGLDGTATLLALGLDSLKIVALVKSLGTSFGATLPLSVAVRSSVDQLVEAFWRATAATTETGRGEQTVLEQLVTWPEADEMDRVNSEPFELTPLQQAYWLGQNTTGPMSGPAHLYFEREARDLDLARFTQALKRLIQRHPMLRSFVGEDGRWRSADDVAREPLVTIDLRDRSAEDQAEFIAETRAQMKSRSPVSWVSPCVDVRALLLGDNRIRLHFATNLLVLDYTSWRILEREWRELYEHPDSEPPPLRLTYAEYAHTVASLQRTEAYRRALSYWEDRLATLPPGPVLPNPREPLGAPRWRSVSIRIDDATWTKLQSKARALGVTSALLLCGAYAEVIGHWSQSQHFTLNLLSQNRVPIHPDVDGVVARFSSTLLLEVDQRSDVPFRGRLLQLQEQFFRDFDQRLVSGVEVARRYNQAHQSGGTASFPVVYASVLGTRGSGSVPMSWIGQLEDRCLKTPQVTLDHQVYEESGELISSWDFIENAFSPGVPDQLIATFEALLIGLANDDQLWAARRPISDGLPGRGRRELLTVPDPLPTPEHALGEFLHGGFVDRVRRDPERVAIITPSLRMSYGEVDRRSNVLARQLIELGAQPNSLVAIVMERGWEQVVAAIAILKAGAAYLPVDVSLVPPARITELLELGEVQIAVTQPRLQLDLEHVTALEVCVSERAWLAPEAKTALELRCSPDDLAYVIFTSGSTGTPKGVMIEHRAVVNTIEDVNARFEVTEDDRVLSLASLGFDLSVWDIFGVLGRGGAVVLPNADARMSPERWHQLAWEAAVTVWNSVPKVMEAFVDHVTEKARLLPPSLRLVMLSGDWIPIALPEAIRDVSRQPGLRIISLGGATEVSIWSIYYPIERVDPSWPSIPYGWSMAGQNVVVLDEHLRVREPWVPGEIFIGGHGLARGYWRNLELTQRSFIESPVDGQRLYRTGDLGRYLPDGSIEFLGRKDTQVKIRGYRVELGEVEARVAQHPQVKQCLVVVRNTGSDATGSRADHERSKQIIAYVIPQDGEILDEATLTEYLSQRLPFYMVPSFIVILKEIPLSKNGKVDRKALPSPERRAEATRQALAPRDETEARVLAIWKRVLGSDGFGIQDAFFDLGGDSIQLIRMASAVEREFAVSFPVESLFGAGLSSVTVGSCAERLRDSSAASPNTKALVPIRAHGDAPRFFAVHPVGGSVLCYGRLASLVGAELRFYGLQSLTLDARRSFDSIPDLAARYIVELREVQPSGPYFLGGWSLGGTIAVEMARQLTRAGQRVDLVVLIDSWAPTGPQGAIHEERFMEWFCRDLGGIARECVQGLLTALQDAAPYSIARAAELIRQYGLVSSEVASSSLVSMYNRYARNVRAGATFEPAPYDGAATLIRATERPSHEFSRHPALRNPALRDPTQGWSSVLTGELSVYDAPGDHYGVVGPEGVETTARLLSGAIQAATRRTLLASGA